MNQPTLFDQIPEVAIRNFGKFHNTINLSGEALEKRKGKNRSQNWLILEFFRKHSYESFTPSELEARKVINAPLTSIRRAVSDLTDQGYLVKTSERRPGKYGMENFTWKLK